MYFKSFKNKNRAVGAVFCLQKVAVNFAREALDI